MDITYKNKRIKRICTNASIAERTYGREMADKIHQRIDQIIASDTVEMMIQYRIGRCHILKHDRRGQYALDLVHPYRLIFEKNGSDIQIAKILEITDYH
ncbi:MAG: type II toxin-antitoxin system RelE/ParE family toxin [Eubacteriaceae bacterium]|nr:type II toxin-antitoxin system RelE/ParE family toxin [Eubacteriaceae bacterium]